MSVPSTGITFMSAGAFLTCRLLARTGLAMRFPLPVSATTPPGAHEEVR
jgi:hypothetical protein